MNIPELIREAKQGSAAAQKYLFDQFADKMMLVCRRYVKSPEDAEELPMNCLGIRISWYPFSLRLR